MKYWTILIVFLLGSALTIVGALFKIQHWPGADIMMTISMGLQLLAVVLLIVKLIKDRTKKGLNK